MPFLLLLSAVAAPAFFTFVAWLLFLRRANAFDAVTPIVGGLAGLLGTLAWPTGLFILQFFSLPSPQGASFVLLFIVMLCIASPILSAVFAVILVAALPRKPAAKRKAHAEKRKLHFAKRIDFRVDLFRSSDKVLVFALVAAAIVGILVVWIRSTMGG